MQFAVPLFAGAVVIGLAGGVVLRDTTPVQQAAQQTPDWKPRNSIEREAGMSAEELDSQQPDSVAFHAARPSNRGALASAAYGDSYRNCREARAAGVTPIYRGQPGYGAHMDGDNDGIACEPIR